MRAIGCQPWTQDSIFAEGKTRPLPVYLRYDFLTLGKMATNTYNRPRKTAAKRKRIDLFGFLENYLNLGGIFEQGLPIRYIPHIFFLTLVGIVYIGNIHYADKNTRKADHLKREVDDLRADYTTLKAEYMYASKQSEVSAKVAKQGLVESSIPPYKIIVGKDKNRDER